jgi:hypothetical protein
MLTAKSEQLVDFCNIFDKTCGNEHGFQFGVNLLGVQIEYQGFNIWYQNWYLQISRILKILREGTFLLKQMTTLPVVPKLL